MFYACQAAIMAVKQAKEKGVENLILYTDSEFLIKGNVS